MKSSLPVCSSTARALKARCTLSAAARMLDLPVEFVGIRAIPVGMYCTALRAGAAFPRANLAAAKLRAAVAALAGESSLSRIMIRGSDGAVGFLRLGEVVTGEADPGWGDDATAE